MLKTALCQSWSHFGLVAFVFFAGFAPAVFAQVVPDAGGILRQIDPNAPPAVKPPPSILLPRETRPALPMGNDITVEVRGFHITSSTAFSEEQLLPLVQDAIGSALNIQELDSVADRITRFYRNRGYLVARAYLPAQEVKSGIVEIAVLEGYYSAINVENQSLLETKHFARYLAPLQQSRAIEQKSLERSLLLVGDAAGVGTVTPTLSPGYQVGGSDLFVNLGEAPRFSGSLDLDNYGGESNGRNRLGFVANLHSPTGRGDQFSLRGIFTPPGFQPSRGPPRPDGVRPRQLRHAAGLQRPARWGGLCRFALSHRRTVRGAGCERRCQDHQRLSFLSVYPQPRRQSLRTTGLRQQALAR